MSTINSSTPLIKLGKEGAPNEYPIYLNQVRRENPDWSFPSEVDLELVQELGYDVVELSEKPAGDVVTEIDPVKVGDVWHQTWTFREFTQEEKNQALSARKADMQQEIDTKLEAALEVGFAFDFPGAEGLEEGHLQLRGGDRGNLAGIGVKADRLADKGITAASIPVRTFENVVYMVTPDQGKRLSDLAYDAYLLFMQQAWALKDQTTAATTVAALPTIPASFELPPGWDDLPAE